MAGSRAILAIDQGTTSTRAIVFDEAGQAVASAQEELPQIYPRDAWVEHDAEVIWQAAVAVCRTALAEAESAGYEVLAAGITNQRETTVVWERATARPIHNAIVWQDRRTAPVCRRLSDEGHASLIQARTGLVLDAYFSATKVAWLLDNVSGARAAAERGELAFGTIDSYLLWRLTGGASHATDATNASRTMLFNIHEQAWDRDLLKLFNVPAVILPAVLDNTADFGVVQTDVLGKAMPITGMAGDQQAATVGQACFSPGMVKSTYGTGCFVVLNTGGEAVSSKNKLLTTVAYRLNGEPTYAIEGSIFVAGAAVQWLRDNLKLIGSADDTEALASGLDGNRGVYMVPAFTGLGAPHWDPDARGAIFGLTRDTGIAEIARATLESVCYQTRDLVVAMADDAGTPLASLRVDGGMVANDWLLSFLADLIETPVERPTVIETTALGAAYLAGLQAGVFESTADIAARWRRDAEFRPTMSAGDRATLVRGWDEAVARVRAAL